MLLLLSVLVVGCTQNQFDTMSQPCLSYLANLLRWYHLPCHLIGGPTLTPITPGVHRRLGEQKPALNGLCGRGFGLV